MPHDSPWPILLAGSMALVFACLLFHQWVVAFFMAGTVVFSLLGWHGEEPQEA